MTELKRKYRGALRIVPLREEAIELNKLFDNLDREREEIDLKAPLNPKYWELLDDIDTKENNLNSKVARILEEAKALSLRAYREIYFILYQRYPDKPPYQGPNRRGTYRKNKSRLFWYPQDIPGKRDSK